jgi:hypothetical protein
MASYKCSYCEYSTDKTVYLKRHHSVKHVGLAYIQPTELPAVEPVSHVCDKCAKTCKSKKFLERHMEKCTGLNGKYTCPGCGHSYRYVNNMYHHRKTCEGFLQQNNPTEPPPEENVEPKGIIYDFENERADYISTDFYHSCIRRLGSNGEGIISMVEKLYMSNEAPENHNVRIPTNKHCNKKHFLEIRKNNRWIIQDKDTIIARMIQYVINLLHRHYESEGGKPLREMDDVYYRHCFVRYCHTFPSYNYKLYRQVYALILNFHDTT